MKKLAVLFSCLALSSCFSAGNHDVLGFRNTFLEYFSTYSISFYGDGNELDLRNSGDGRIKLQAHWDAKVVRQPVQIETELISNGSDGLAYGDTLEMTAVVNVQPTDAKWSIRWQYSQDGEHFEDVEGANEMRYAVKLDKINAQYYWRFVVSVED